MWKTSELSYVQTGTKPEPLTTTVTLTIVGQALHDRPNILKTVHAGHIANTTSSSVHIFQICDPTIGHDAK